MSNQNVTPVTKEEVVDMMADLEAHLDYCGWGDSWERECAEELRVRLGDLNERLEKERIK